MNFQMFSKDLPSNKRRQVNDLSRFVSTRTDSNPNYTLLLGAGCSVTSGVRSGAELSSIWRRELYSSEIKKNSGNFDESADAQRAYLKQYCSSWYDPSREYSSLFERKFDLQRQRRMFVEAEVSGKKPSIGYAYLTALVNSSFFGTIFTTNFDDLINEAFYLYSGDRPIVCAHDSSINSITVTSKRPKIIKLHGDYLFDDIKSTARETESLEQNMKEKFIEFSKDFGLVVVGYSGADRSIMDLLSLLLKNDDYFKGGIYWCMRPDSEVTEELKKLLWKDRVYFVEVDGFDELFAELYSDINSGEVLPLSALSASRRPNEIVNKLLSTDRMFPQTNDVLRGAREKLLRQSKRLAIAESLADPGSNDRSPFERNGLTEDELLMVTDIQRMISSGSYKDAVEKAHSYVKSGVRKILQRRLLRLVISAYRLLGNPAKAVDACDELIRLQPMNASNYLLKSAASVDVDQKLVAMNKALEVDKYSVNSHLDLARHYSALANDCYGVVSDENRAKALKLLEKAVELDPSESNPAWGELFYLFINSKNGQSDCNARDIVDKLNVQNPCAYRVLSLRGRLISDKTIRSDVDQYLKDVQFAQERIGDEDNSLFFELRLGALDRANMLNELKSEIDAADSKLANALDPDLALKVASILRNRFCDDEKAISILDDALKNFDFSADVFSAIIVALSDLKRFDQAEILINKYGHKVVPRFLSSLKSDFFVAKGDYDQALTECKLSIELSGLQKVNSLIFILLLKKDYLSAEGICRDFLEKCSFTPEAAAELVNFEISRKCNGRKIDIGRLEGALKFSSDEQTRAAIFAILSRKNEAIAAAKEALKKNGTFRFDAARWPAFDGIRDDSVFIKDVLNFGAK